MIIPKDILTKHKIRDAKILEMYLREDMSAKNIAGLLKLSPRQINRIIYKNREVLKIDKEYEKQKRINHLKRLLKTNPNVLGKKGTLDILDQLRVETEGNKVEHFGKVEGADTKIIIIRDGDKAKALSRQVHIQQGEVSGNGVVLGDGQVNVRNTPGYDILRADTEQPGHSIP